MNTLEFDIELLTEVSLPARSRSLDDAGSRHYIPGASLLGCAARRLHASLDAATAFRIFQTAQVRFLDGLPVLANQRTLPMPRSLHHEKGRDSDSLLNLAQHSRPDEIQLKPYASDSWVTSDLKHRTTLHTTTTMRTALRPDGRALDGLLFSLNVLPAGLHFRACVSATSKEDLELVAKALEGRHQIGRARGTEIGLVRVTRRTPVAAPATPAQADRISLLCVGSLALRDPDTGMPTFTPRASDFGLPETWKLDLHRSFIRTERYTPFHGTRGLPDLERHLIERGSVLTFEGKHADMQAVANRLARGVGEYRNAGHGEVLIMDGALTLPDVARPTHIPPTTTTVNNAPAPSDALFAWAKREADQRRAAHDLMVWAKGQASKAGHWGVPASQWGVVRRMARAARIARHPSANFIKTLEDHIKAPDVHDADGKRQNTPKGKRGVAQTDRAWGKRIGATTAAVELLELLKIQKDPSASAELLAELVVRAARHSEDDR
jgi:CRISPR-associated protein Csx10